MLGAGWCWLELAGVVKRRDEDPVLSAALPWSRRQLLEADKRPGRADRLRLRVYASTFVLDERRWRCEHGPQERDQGEGCWRGTIASAVSPQRVKGGQGVVVNDDGGRRRGSSKQRGDEDGWACGWKKRRPGRE